MTRLSTNSHFWLPLALVALGACSDAPSGVSEARGRGRVEALVDARGGRLVVEGVADLRVPAGALDAPVRLEVEALERQAVPDPRAIDLRLSAPVAVRPHGQTFLEEVVLELTVDPGDRPERWPDRLAVFRLEDERATDWERVMRIETGGLEGETPRVRVRTDRFSVYMVGLLREMDAGMDGGAGTMDAGGDAAPGMDGGQAVVDAGADARFDGAADATPDATQDAGPVMVALSSAPLWPAHADFNTWVRATGAAPQDTPDVACDPAVDALCLHGGAHRVIPLTGFVNCTGVLVQDDLTAFEWQCLDDTSPPRAISTGLQEGRSVRDLIDWSGAAPAWRPITVFAAGVATTGVTAAESWWSNPIVADPPSSLDAAGSVYAVTANASLDYVFAADNVTLIADTGAVLQGGLSSTTVVDDGAQDFAWIEADVVATSGVEGIVLGGRHGRVRHASVASAPGGGIFVGTHTRLQQVTVSDCATAVQMNGAVGAVLEAVQVVGSSGVGIDASGETTDARFDEVQILDSGSRGFDLGGSNHEVRGLTVANSAQAAVNLSGDGHRFDGIWLHENGGNNGSQGFVSSASRSVFSRMHVSNSGLSGINSTGSNNVLIDVVVGASGGGGLATSSGSAHVLLGVTSINGAAGGYIAGADDRLVAGLVANNAGAGLTVTQPGVVIHDIALLNNDSTGTDLDVYSPADPFDLRGLLVVTAAATSCSDQSGSGLFSGGTCNPAAGGFTTAVSSVAGDLIGMPVSDLLNTEPSSVEASGTITDWTSFESPYRAWNRNGAYATAGSRGKCNMGDCAIHDARLQTSSFLVDALAAPLDGTSDVVSHLWAAADLAACDALGFATWTGSACVSDSLARAHERLDDGIGNENGLCESGETCVRLRNLGAYQGEGTLVSTPGAFVDGTISGVTLLEYANNGI